jgi:hypothetical protein
VKASRALAAALAGPVLAACGDPGRFASGRTGGGETVLTVSLTDASDTLLDSVSVAISRVEIISVSGAGVTLTDSAGTFNLLTLTGGQTADLATATVAATRYVALRVFVDSARVTLRQGLTFSDGTDTLTVFPPAGADSGITISLDGADGLPATDGVFLAAGAAAIVVDFDVSQNFVVQGDPATPAGITGVQYTPLLRAVQAEVAGSLTGTVVSSAGLGVVGLEVRALAADPGSLETFQTAVATALTDSLGAFTVNFLAPGLYTVTVDSARTSPTSRSVTVSTGAVAGAVDFDRTL